MFAVLSENTRAADSDRDDTCRKLDAALADGQLSMEEHRERVSTATNAITLGELGSLVSDLQIHPDSTQLPTPKPLLQRRDIRTVVAVALVLVAGAAWGLHSGTPPRSNPSASTVTSTAGSTSSSNASDPLGPTPPTPTPPPQLLTLSGMTGVLAQMRAQFGDTMGYQLVIYQEQVVVERPDTANAHKTVAWVFRNDGWTNLGPAGATAPSAAIGDLSKFDVHAVLGVLNTAPQTLHIYDPSQIYLTVESAKDGSLHMNIHVSDNSNSGSIAIAADGTVLTSSPPAR
jgi:Domain of unknown function (DUF1707)